MAWECCHITGTDRLVSKEELEAALAAVNSQTSGNLDKKAPTGATSTDEGGVEHVDHAVSTSTITENGGFVRSMQADHRIR